MRDRAPSTMIVYRIARLAGNKTSTNFHRPSVGNMCREEKPSTKRFASGRIICARSLQNLLQRMVETSTWVWREVRKCRLRLLVAQTTPLLNRWCSRVFRAWNFCECSDDTLQLQTPVEAVFQTLGLFWNFRWFQSGFVSFPVTNGLTLCMEILTTKSRGYDKIERRFELFAQIG